MGFKGADLIGPFNTFDARFQLTQRILDLSALARLEAGASEVNAAQYEEGLARQKVVLIASLAYLDALRAHGGFKAAQASLPLSRRILLHRPLAAKIVRGIVMIARTLCPEIVVSGELLDRWFTDRVDNRYQTETARLTEPDVVAPLENWLDQDLTKLLLLGQAADLTAIADAVHKKYPHQVRILQTEDNLLQITHATVSKAQALRTVAAEMTVQREQVMAIGDNANDVGMLRWAGIGVAMANACPAALAAADFVTDSHDADGAANAIRRIILEGKIPENVTNAPRHRGRPKVRGE